MSIVVLQLPKVKGKNEGRPRRCPYCEGQTFQRWGQVKKAVKDTRLRRVGVYRYRCCHCRRTFRHYPEGTSRADQTERLRQFAVICWTLGLSYRGVSTILSGLNIPLSHMSIWRDAQMQAGEINKRNEWGNVRVLGVDGAYVLGWGDTRGVLVAVDLGTGQPVCVGRIDERDPQALRRWLEPLVQKLGVSVIVTDDLFSYRKVAEQLNLGHQVCQFHFPRWVGKALRDFQHSIPSDWQWLLAEVQGLIDDLPPDGDKRLYALWKELAIPRSGVHTISPLHQLRDLLLRLSEHWQSYCLFYREPEVPWTNNSTEQVIGRMKMRARTVRGYKSWQGMQTGLLLAGTRS